MNKSIKSCKQDSKAVDITKNMNSTESAMGRKGFQRGNSCWSARKSHGRNKKFKSPEQLWDACIEYFQWVEDNPLQSAELVKYRGSAKLAAIPKMRAMTISGLCLFLDISDDTWRNYRNNNDFLGVTTRVEDVIYTHKFEGAAAGMLNPNIIARDLKLRDVREYTGNEDSPIPFIVIHDEPEQGNTQPVSRSKRC